MSKPFLTVKKFSEKVGLSEATVRRLVSSGGIVSAQPGGKGARILIPEDALERTIAPNFDEQVHVDEMHGNVRPERRYGPVPNWKR